jgi:hypothetical protein
MADGSIDRRCLQGGLFVDNLPVEQVHRPICMTRISRVVCDHADGGTATMEFAKQLHDDLAVSGIEVPRGLVGQQNRRIASDCSSDGNTLLLASRELAWIVLGSVSHTHSLER